MKRIVLIATLLLAPPAWSGDDFYAGLVAYNRGNYAQAIAYWRPLADRRHAKAQSGLGYLYFKGLGVAQDPARAAAWFEGAAAQGEPGAQTFLGLMHFFGNGLPRDNVRALAWWELALGNGQVEALEWRDHVAEQMTRAEIERAWRLAARWRRAAAPSP